MIVKNTPDPNRFAPKLGPIRRRGEHGAAGGEIFSFQDIEPEGPRGSIHDPPPPLNDKALVHHYRIKDSKPPKAFRPANGLPFDKPAFTLIVRKVLVESPLCLSKPA